jgi:hypothetical protein
VIAFKRRSEAANTLSTRDHTNDGNLAAVDFTCRAGSCNVIFHDTLVIHDTITVIIVIIDVVFHVVMSAKSSATSIDQ